MYTSIKQLFKAHTISTARTNRINEPIGTSFFHAQNSMEGGEDLGWKL